VHNRDYALYSESNHAIPQYNRNISVGSGPQPFHQTWQIWAQEAIKGQKVLPGGRWRQ